MRKLGFGKAMTQNGRGLALAVTLVMAAGVLSACNDSSASDEKEAKAVAPAKPGMVQVKPASLKMLTIEPVAPAGAPQRAWAPARVAFLEDRVSSVAVPVPARVQTVSAHVGDIVKAGAELATLVSPDALRVRYEVAAARSAHDVAVVEAQRQQTMMSKGVGVEVELRAAEARVRETAQELSRAQGTAALLGAGSGDRVVLRAPRDGIVAERNAIPGAAVDPGNALFVVGDPKAMGVVAEVFESDLPGVKVGTIVSVELPNASTPLTGKVRNVGATLDKESRRAAVIITLDPSNAPQPELRPGMQARVGMLLAGKPEITIPVTAVLIKDESHNIVFVQRSDTEFEARDVMLGRPSRGMIPVVSGLQPGERIVVRGGLLLDGAAAQLL
jgi:cobalt-zinc-cadmium efflux system membrane fusion protein